MSQVMFGLDKYNSDYVDKIALVAKGLTELSVKLNYRWCEDETIPTGWKMRKVAHSGDDRTFDKTRYYAGLRLRYY